MIMEYMHPFICLPSHRKLLYQINTAAQRLHRKLKHVDISRLNISEYNKVYLKNRQKSLRYFLHIYSYILSWSLVGFEDRVNQLVYMDYGGGTGILSLLAKELGIGTVIYNDIFEVSCDDARIIAETIGNRCDYYVPGDIDQVIDFLQTNSLQCDVLGCYDVIEHIYDIESFFHHLPALSDGPLNIVLSSGANTFNPLVRRHEMKTQLRVELQDRPQQEGHKERDSVKAYKTLRREIIQENAPHLGEQEIEHLATLTRGMIQTDIEKAVDAYQKSGDLPPTPEHPTNTCDPLTGNWAEHLMDPYRLRDTLATNGFRVEVLNGYYGHPQNKLKQIVGFLINLAIYQLKKSGIYLSPFYTIYAKR
jgi:2-polyprenyl-3-methyl-5-hydroxy-6-metoxy-1,4-benzoquinol methylase